jgi:hypothetical protein
MPFPQDPAHARRLHAERVVQRAVDALEAMFKRSRFRTKVDLAHALTLSPQGVKGAFRGVNLRIKTFAEMAYEMGYDVRITLVPLSESRGA